MFRQPDRLPLFQRVLRLDGSMISQGGQVRVVWEMGGGSGGLAKDRKRHGMIDFTEGSLKPNPWEQSFSDSEAGAFKNSVKSVDKIG